MKTVAIIQARTGSSRLPGKVLLDLAGRTMLERVVRRTARATRVDEVVVATTDDPADDAIVTACAAMGAHVVRGPIEDVLMRYLIAARAHAADVIVRITSDCPLIDAATIDEVIEVFQREGADYASNTLERSYPRGLDVEVIGRAILEEAGARATREHERVHVTPYVYGHPELFKLRSVRRAGDRSALRWTVDTPLDLEVVRALYARLGGDDTFSFDDALAVADADPSLCARNAEVVQKALEEL